MHHGRDVGRRGSVRGHRAWPTAERGRTSRVGAPPRDWVRRRGLSRGRRVGGLTGIRPLDIILTLGDVAKWLRRGSAKPLSSVRFRPSPPVPTEPGSARGGTPRTADRCACTPRQRHIPAPRAASLGRRRAGRSLLAHERGRGEHRIQRGGSTGRRPGCFAARALHG